MEYVIGEKVTVLSNSIPGEGHEVVEYEWKWDDIQIPNTFTLDIIEIDTTNKSIGTHVVSLRILNDCGEWSNIDTETIELFEEEPIPKPVNMIKILIPVGIGLLGLKLFKKDSS